MKVTNLKGVTVMNVDVWSDFACPFCYIGKRRFESGLSRFAHKDDVTIVFRSFRLDPSTPREPEQDIHTALAAKYGMSREQAMEANRNVGEQAAAEGLTFRFDTMQVTNTLDAHRLTHFAEAHGKREALTELLFKAYFTDSDNLCDRETLLRIAGEAGLDRSAADEVLAGDQFTDNVHIDEEIASQLGVRGVPFFVVNNKYAVSGAQPAELFLEVLEKAWAEEHGESDAAGQALNTETADEAGICTDDGCEVPKG
ncbi:DsbA family oxidoreductase [Paenibacillus tarimensis]|nr:DsbA family oxidoreductase [Paenibacillus tarimensis]MCF2945288.1 DsbA family oxidoreductase [Paenibacillus tarimensis]